ncbi:MAG: hypothetical protein NVS9B15_12760 [Acidobacteriaceae bacterium]
MFSAYTRLVHLFCFAFLLFAASCFAQQSSSALNGTVLDPSSAAIPNAEISVLDVSRGIAKSLHSDQQGRFLVPDLYPGTYRVNVSAPSFAPYQEDVELLVGKTATLTLHLSIRAETRTVTVDSASAALDSSSSSVDSVITAQQIKNLPLNGRNYLELAFLAPGNAPAPTFDPTKNHTVLISSAGQVGRGSTVMVDGADNSDDVVGGSLVNIPQDAVAEFQMATNRFSAALGRSGSSVTNVVTKQGTNELHGNISFFERDKRLGASPDNFSAAGISATPPFHRQQYAASLGGPIVSDRAWWFIGVEDRQQLGGLLIGTRDLASQTISRSFAPQPLHDWLSTARVDWQARAHDRFTVRQSLELEDDQSGSAPDRAISSASQQQRSNNHLQSISAEWAHTFSTSLLNQLRFSDNNFMNAISPIANLPQITFPSIVDGASFRVPQQTRQFRLKFWRYSQLDAWRAQLLLRCRRPTRRRRLFPRSLPARTHTGRRRLP